MFRTVSLSIFRSVILYIQHHVYVIQVLWLLASRFADIYHCCVYSEKLLMRDRRNCPKHVEFHSKINLRN